jgi:uncharacterized protein (TIGR02996 family)
MTRELQALYRAICDQPDEDTPRLAFADLLDECGNTARAAFIRTQVALARVPEYDPFHITTRQLHPDAVHGWCRTDDLPPIPRGYSWDKFEFRRGFPWKTGMSSLPECLGTGGSVFRSAPVQAFSIDTRRQSDLALLADWPHLSRVRLLEFSLGQFGADALARLADSPHASQLTALVFQYYGISADGLQALAASPLFGRLEVLELHSNMIPPPLLVDALAAARGPGSLARLALVWSGLTGADAAALFALPVLHSLDHLDLSQNRQLGSEGVTALAESGILRGLRVLNLRGTLPGTTGVRALTEANGLSRLRSLDLSANRLGPVAVSSIVESGLARGLRVLNLSRNPIGDKGAVALAGARGLSGLLELDLDDTDLTDAGAFALAESPYLGGLLRLSLASYTRTARPFGEAARRALLERFGRHVRFNRG